MSRSQPVYKKETRSCDQPLRRSLSAPNLSEWPVMRKTVPAPAPPCRTSDDEDEDEETVRMRFEKHRMKRRRALSQNKMRSLLRRTKATSEIDLAHIDKEATFGADIASYEILSRVVDALETAVPTQPVGHQQLADHQDTVYSVSIPTTLVGFRYAYRFFVFYCNSVYQYIFNFDKGFLIHFNPFCVSFLKSAKKKKEKSI